MERLSDTELLEGKKAILLKIIGKVVNNQRTLLGKGINRFSYEYDIGNGLLSRLENGTTDSKITTLWKLADAFNIKFSDFVKLIEEELPKNYNFYES